MSYITNPTDALNYLTKHIENITKKLDDTYEKPKKLEVYPTLPDILFKNLKDLNNIGHSSSYYNSYGKDHNETKSPEETQTRYISLCKVLDNYLPTIEDIKIKNEVIIQHNNTVKDKITSIMTSIGIPLNFSERDYNSRARNPKSITKSAGYIGDISKNIITVDSEYTKRATLVKTVKTNLDTWYKGRLDFSKSLEQAKQIKDKELERQKLFATIKVKYNIDFSVDDNDVLDNLLSKDKYLYLAHYMLKNREDWEWETIRPATEKEKEELK